VKLHIVVVKFPSVVGRGRFPDHVLTVNNELRRPDDEEAGGWRHVPKDEDGRKDTVKIGRSEASRGWRWSEYRWEGRQSVDLVAYCHATP
jgi:hypothetical protein